MKYLIMAIAITTVLVWPINYFSVNQRPTLLPQTVFEQDYQGRQLILRNINLYPNIPLARAFQNKAVIIVRKYLNNLFNFIDPNYYFFGSHPREVPEGQNYTRLPLLSILPIFWFLFRVKNKKRKLILSLFTVIVLSLSFFTNHFLYDFSLWPFFVPAIYLGLSELIKKNSKLGIIFLILLLVETVYEINLSLP